MASSSQRYGFIDAHRGWAVIVMIETHCLNEWLSPEMKQLAVWKFMTFVNGLVAPSFIMLAGFSLSIATVRKWNDYTTLTPALWKRMRHLLLIFAVGYLLHLPAPHLREWLFNPDPVNIAMFQAVDVLQLIVMGLWIMHAVVLVFRSRAVLFYVSLALGVIVLVLTPWTYNTTAFDGLPLWLANWFNRANGSLFPFFPWSAYIFLGTALALKFVEAQEKGRMQQFLHRMGYCGFLLIFIGFVWDAIPWTIQPHYDFWRTSPQFNLVRIGCVMAILWLLWILEDRFNRSPGFPKLMGQESFLVYALHLMVLYNQALGDNIVSLFEGQFNFAEALTGYLLLLLLMYAVAYGWHSLKRKNMTAARIVMVSLYAIGAFFFVLFENGRFVFWILE